MKKSRNSKKWFKKLVDGFRKNPVNPIVLLFAITLLILGIITSPLSWKAAIENLSAELIGMAITVLVLDRLYAYRDQQREKQRIILQMASPSNDFALQATRIAEDEKWLFDGSLRGINFSLANLKNSLLWGGKFEEAKFVLANLENANLRECQFQKTRFSKANMRNSDLRDANLIEARLDDTNLSNANLEGANLQGANLKNAIFTKANLKGVNLKNALLDGTKFNGVTIDNTTKFPEGFTIKKRGIKSKNINKA